MPEKLDNSPEEEAVKHTAREFMQGLVGSAPEEQSISFTPSPAGSGIIQQWKEIYLSKSSIEEKMQQFWKLYDSNKVSLWSMTYDYADSNENITDTISMVKDLLSKPNMAKIEKDTFAIVHTLNSLEMEGLWLLNGPDPEILFGVNEDTSWYTFSQIGPEATELVKAAVEKYFMGGELNGKKIADSQVF